MAIEPPATSAAQRLDPGVRAFVDAVMREGRRLTGDTQPSVARMREIAEEVRAPWRNGGPVMARVFERDAADGPGVRLRFHVPGGAAAPNGALVYLHGGGWTMFSLDTHDRVMREYAARSGLTVVGVDYALSPEAKFPVALGQAQAVVDWLSVRGADVGIDPARIAIGGDSAGANLALATAIALRDSGGSARLRALVLNYGCFKVGSSLEAAETLGGPEAMLSADEMAWFWGNYLRSEADAADPLACPLLADLGGLPPAFIAVADQDVLAEQSWALAERLTDADTPARAVAYRGAAHSFLEAVAVSPLSAQALQDASDWLRPLCR